MEKTIFFVPGLPVTQGSTKAFARKIGGKYRAIVTHEHGEALKLWRHAVGVIAKKAMTDEGYEAPTVGPVRLSLTFSLPRPKSHFRKSGALKEKYADAFPVRGDLDKYTRAIGDALTGIVYTDDKQIVEIRCKKQYAPAIGVDIIVER